MKRIILSILLLLFIVTFAFPQDHAVDKGAFIISGTVDFYSSGGDLYWQETIIELMTSNAYFFAPNVLVGLKLGTAWDFDEYFRLVIGPQLGYAAGKADSKINPYITAGFQFLYTADWNYSETGTNINIAAGMIFSLKKHLGLVMEAGVDLSSMGGNSGHIIYVGVGLAGLFFKGN